MGPRGLTVLSIAGIAGIIFGISGWTQRDAGLVTPSALAPQPPAATGSPSAGASQPAGPAGPAGPLLAAEPYASYAYQVWPGTVSADGRLALDGFSLTVTRKAGGITVNAIQDGEKMTGASHFYPGGAKVYIVDSSLGDEGGSVDYNLADDGLVVTNAQGQVLG